MNFSLVPRWSKTPRVKFATHNARIETILEKPTWKVPFSQNHCLVPISEFIESITDPEKTLAGHLVRISSEDNRTLVAAGIYDKWVDKNTGEILESFAILTDEPPQDIIDIGHDRCPIFLKPDSQLKWLDLNANDNESLHFLKSHRDQIKFKAVVDRPLKPGWQNR